MKIGKSVQRSVNDSIKFSLNDPIWVSTMTIISNPVHNLYNSVFSRTFNSVINSLRFLRWR